MTDRGNLKRLVVSDPGHERVPFDDALLGFEPAARSR
jgi:hypothetical protein